MAHDLGPEKALIFRITHRDNVLWILDHGLHCGNSAVRDPNFIAIGNQDLIERRRSRAVPGSFGGTLCDYVPFYFTPHSPMLYNIKTGWGGITKRANEEIVIFVASLFDLRRRDIPFVFADRHAYLAAAQFYSNLDRLDQIQWTMLRERDFRNNPDDPSRKERYQAEALIYRHLPIDCLLGVVGFDDHTTRRIEQGVKVRHLDLRVVMKPGWYFQ